jgi:hypothetical protein
MPDSEELPKMSDPKIPREENEVGNETGLSVMDLIRRVSKLEGRLDEKRILKLEENA